MPLDSILLSNPFVIADRQTTRYYMTGTGEMRWMNWIDDVYTQGVVYSQSGTSAGPWMQEKNHYVA